MIQLLVIQTYYTVLIQAMFSLNAVGTCPNLGIWLLFKRFFLGLAFYFLLGTDAGRSIRFPGVAVVTKCKNIGRLQCYSLIS